MQEIEVLTGIHKSLEGLGEIVESLPDTADNADLWQAITEAEQIAKEIITRE